MPPRLGRSSRNTRSPIRCARIDPPESILRAIRGIRRVGDAFHHPLSSPTPGLWAWRSCWPAPPRRPPRVVPPSSSTSTPSPAARSWSGYRPGTNWARAALRRGGPSIAGPGRPTATARPAMPRECIPLRLGGLRSVVGLDRLSAGCRLAGLFAGRGPADQHETRPRPRAEPLCRRAGSELPRIRHGPAGAAGQALAARLAVRCLRWNPRTDEISTTKTRKHEKLGRPARRLRNTNRDRPVRSFSCISCISWEIRPGRFHGSFEPEEQPALRRREPRSSAAPGPSRRTGRRPAWRPAHRHRRAERPGVVVDVDARGAVAADVERGPDLALGPEQPDARRAVRAAWPPPRAASPSRRGGSTRPRPSASRSNESRTLPFLSNRPNPGVPSGRIVNEARITPLSSRSTNSRASIVVGFSAAAPARATARPQPSSPIPKRFHRRYLRSVSRLARSSVSSLRSRSVTPGSGISMHPSGSTNS